jgi:hypothetical protein
MTVYDLSAQSLGPELLHLGLIDGRLPAPIHPRGLSLGDTFQLGPEYPRTLPRPANLGAALPTLIH